MDYAKKLPWQVWACFWCMLFFAFMHIWIAIAKGVVIFYGSYALETLLAIGLLKLWKWAYWVTIVISLINVILLIIGSMNNPLAIPSLVISAAYIALVIKTYRVIFLATPVKLGSNKSNQSYFEI